MTSDGDTLAHAGNACFRLHWGAFFHPGNPRFKKATTNNGGLKPYSKRALFAFLR